MLLRNSILNTKKFFQKTVENFKSFLSKGTTYEKIPKTPKIEVCNKELDNFYVEFTNEWDSDKGKLRNRAQKKHKNNQDSYTKRNLTTPMKTSNTYESQPQKPGNGDRNEGLRSTSSLSLVRGFRPLELCSRSVRERRLDMVYHKLKELEVVDKGNVDHKMDIEEVLYYYSRLTCPAYLDIVDKFFKEIFTQFLASPLVSTPVNIMKPSSQ